PSRFGGDAVAKRQPSVRSAKPALVMLYEPGFFRSTPSGTTRPAWEAESVSDLKFDVPIPTKPADTHSRTAALHKALDERILVLDGATGTALQAAHLTAADFGGPELEGCNEYLCITRPDVVDGVSERYLRAGCDIVETDSFGGTPLVLGEYGLA